MTARIKLWILAFSPFLAIGGYCLSTPNVHVFNLYDIAYLTWLMIALYTLRFSWFHRSQISLGSRWVCSLFILGGLTIAVYGCNLCYLSAEAIARPWLLAQLGFPFAQYRMAIAEQGLIDHTWIIENGAVKYLSYTRFGSPPLLIQLDSALRTQERITFSKVLYWLKKAMQSGCQPAGQDLIRLLSIVDPSQLIQLLRTPLNQRFSFVDEEIGKSYESGRNDFSRDESMASYWYLRAAYNDSVFAMTKIASSYVIGWGAFAKDDRLASLWRERTNEYWLTHKGQYFEIYPCDRPYQE